MTKLVKLNHTEHSALKITHNCTVNVVEKQHVIALRVTEVGQAATCFPIFIGRAGDSEEWSLSAMASFEPGTNLFVKGERWDAAHVPINMQTYPLFLIPAKDEEKGYAVGIVASDKAFSEEKGEAIFNDDGSQTDFVKRMVSLLEDDIRGAAQTRNFTQTLADLDLLRSTDVLVHYAGGKINRIQGLFTIDEEKVRNLKTDSYLELRDNGYIIAIHAIMLSTYQLKGLINQHNESSDRQTVTQVKMEFLDQEKT